MVGSSSVEVSRYAAQDVIMAGGVGGLGPGRWGAVLVGLGLEGGGLCSTVEGEGGASVTVGETSGEGLCVGGYV